MRLSVLTLVITGFGLNLGYGDQAHAQYTEKKPTNRDLIVLPPKPVEPGLGNPLISIPELPPGDPHHAVIEAVRATMAQACIACHSNPHAVNRTETLGLSLAPADPALREQLGLENRGLVVTGVEPQSPAASAGIVENDIVLASQNNFVATVDDFKTSVKNASGKELVLGLLHEGVSKIVTIPARPEPGTSHSYGFAPGQTAPRADPYWIGVAISPASATLRTHLRLSDGIGLVVNDVVNDSPAARAGIKTNDVLLKVGDTPLKGLEDLVHAVQDAKDQRALAIHLRRAGQDKEIEVKPEKRKVESTLRVDPGPNVVARPLLQPPVVYRMVKPRTMIAPMPIDPSQTPFPFVHSGDDIRRLQPFTVPGNAARLDQIDAQLKELTKQIKELKESMEGRKESDKKPPQTGSQ